MQQSGKQPQIPDRLTDHKSQTHKYALSQKKSLMKEGNGVGETVNANEIKII